MSRTRTLEEAHIQLWEEGDSDFVVGNAYLNNGRKTVKASEEKKKKSKWQIH